MTLVGVVAAPAASAAPGDTCVSHASAKGVLPAVLQAAEHTDHGNHVDGAWRWHSLSHEGVTEDPGDSQSCDVARHLVRTSYGPIQVLQDDEDLQGVTPDRAAALRIRWLGSAGDD